MVLSTLLKYAGPRGCELTAEPTLSFHVDGMDAMVIAVPSADVAKLVGAATDDRYKVAALLDERRGHGSEVGERTDDAVALAAAHVRRRVRCPRK